MTCCVTCYFDSDSPYIGKCFFRLESCALNRNDRGLSFCYFFLVPFLHFDPLVSCNLITRIFFRSADHYNNRVGTSCMGAYYVLNIYNVLYFTYNTLHTYRAIHSYTGLYTAIQGYTQLYRAIHSYTRLYTAIPGYTQLYRAIHSYTGLNTAIQG